MRADRTTASRGDAGSAGPEELSPADLAARFRREFGDACTAAGADAAAIDGRCPSVRASPSSPDEAAAMVRLAEDLGLGVVPRGRGAFAHIGNRPRRYDVALATGAMAALRQHNAADMTVTAEAGMTLGALDRVLGEAGQWLPLDPPRPEELTVGGLIATDANGGLRLAHGKVRDYLIGVRAVIGGGRIVRGGGQVVKNVAGYDLPKLLVGSFGTLGVIVEATFKVRPRPAAMAAIAAPVATPRAALAHAAAVLNAPVAPFAVDVIGASVAGTIGLAPRTHVVVRCGGEEAEVRDQLARLSDMLPGVVRVADEHLARLRDLPLDGPGILGCRLSVLPGALDALIEAIEEEAAAFGMRPFAIAHAGCGVVRLRAEPIAGAADGVLPMARWLMFLARQHGGYAVIEDLPAAAKDGIDVWGTSSAIGLMRRVKAALDPRSTFSPGRFIGGI